MSLRPHTCHQWSKPISTTTTTHRIDLTPAKSPERAVMRHRGEVIGESSQPLCRAARYLLERGIAVDGDRIETYREGTLCLSAGVGVASRLTVRETADHAAQFIKYVPIDRSRFSKAA